MQSFKVFPLKCGNELTRKAATKNSTNAFLISQFTFKFNWKVSVIFNQSTFYVQQYKILLKSRKKCSLDLLKDWMKCSLHNMRLQKKKLDLRPLNGTKVIFLHDETHLFFLNLEDFFSFQQLAIPSTLAFPQRFKA